MKYNNPRDMLSIKPTQNVRYPLQKGFFNLSKPANRNESFIPLSITKGWEGFQFFGNE